jgi:hypothetical protein
VHAEVLDEVKLNALLCVFGKDAVGDISDLDELRELALRIPVRLGGMGYYDIKAIAPGAFLAGVLASMAYIEASFPPEHCLCRMLRECKVDVRDATDVAASESRSPAANSDYATEVAGALESFNSLFQEVHGRPPDGERDQFEGTLDGLVTVSPKFQQRFTELRGRADAMRLEALSNDEQKAMLRSQASAASAPFLMGVPSPTNSYPNAEFQLLAGRRLLNLNLSHSASDSTCPAWPGNCSGSGQILRVVNDAHLDCCGGVLGGHLYLRHEQLKAAVAGACSAAGGKVAHVDANQDPVTTRLLRDSGSHQVGIRGGSFGGDILVRGLNGHLATTKPIVIDVTVTCERSVSNRSVLWAAEKAEKRKADKYADMYAKINYEFVGFAVEVGGRLGPGAAAFFGRLRDRWEAKEGRRAVPELANWSCPSFTSYWRQRTVAAVQLHSAALFLARARRMAELHIVGVGHTSDAPR